MIICVMSLYVSFPGTFVCKLHFCLGEPHGLNYKISSGPPTKSFERQMILHEFVQVQCTDLLLVSRECCGPTLIVHRFATFNSGLCTGGVKM